MTIYGMKKGAARITTTVIALKNGKKKTKTFKYTTAVTVKSPAAKLEKKSLKAGQTTKVRVSNVPRGSKITYSSTKGYASVDSKEL